MPGMAVEVLSSMRSTLDSTEDLVGWREAQLAPYSVIRFLENSFSFPNPYAAVQVKNLKSASTHLGEKQDQFNTRWFGPYDAA